MGIKKKDWSKEAHQRHAKKINENSDKRIDYTKTQKMRIDKMPDIEGRY